MRPLKTSVLKKINRKIIIISLLAPIVVFGWIFANNLLGKSFVTIVNFNDFIDFSQWIQTFAVIATTGFSYLVYEQLLLQRQIATADAYKRIAAKEYRNTRRLLCNDVCKQLLEGLKTINSDTDFQNKLNDFKKNFNDFTRQLKDEELKKVSINDVEELLNEYNAFGRLVITGAFDDKYLPKQAIENIKDFHRKIDPYIKFRRLKHKEYAIDYTVWINEIDKKD